MLHTHGKRKMITEKPIPIYNFLVNLEGTSPAVLKAKSQRAGLAFLPLLCPYQLTP